MKKELHMLALLSIIGTAAAQKSHPGIPTSAVTYQMNLSTIIMPCNSSGLMSPESTAGWGIVDFDWSNAKAQWAQAKPMNCEEMLVEQVKQSGAASPGQTYMVYRNGIKALPWYTTVREKLTDPAYAPWFLSFSKDVIADHNKSHVPVCDDNYSPPRCSDLYHDQQQTPGYPSGDGVCAAPGCDVGSVPVGEYLFDHRAANVSVNGQTMMEWLMDDYLFSAISGLGNPLIYGYYFDDSWTAKGPSECDKSAVIDMGLSQTDVDDLVVAYTWIMDTVYATMLAKKKFAWNQLSNTYSDGVSGLIDCPGPMVSKGTCAADLRKLCSKDSKTQTYGFVYSFTPAEGKGPCGGHCDPSVVVDPEGDVANFLLTRGPYAWLGHGWCACNVEFAYPEQLNGDYGEPLGLCTESETESGVFTREWTKSTIQMDCNTYTPTITMK